MRRLVAAYTVGSLIVALVGQVMCVVLGEPPEPMNGFCFPQPQGIISTLFWTSVIWWFLVRKPGSDARAA
jgi:hypothetical protein